MNAVAKILAEIILEGTKEHLESLIDKKELISPLELSPLKCIARNCERVVFLKFGEGYN